MRENRERKGVDKGREGRKIWRGALDSDDCTAVQDFSLPYIDSRRSSSLLQQFRKRRLDLLPVLCSLITDSCYSAMGHFRMNLRLRDT